MDERNQPQIFKYDRIKMIPWIAAFAILGVMLFLSHPYLSIFTVYPLAVYIARYILQPSVIITLTGMELRNQVGFSGQIPDELYAWNQISDIKCVHGAKGTCFIQFLGQSDGEWQTKRLYDSYDVTVEDLATTMSQAKLGVLETAHDKFFLHAIPVLAMTAIAAFFALYLLTHFPR